MPTDTSALSLYQPLIVGLGAVVLGTFGNTVIEWYRAYLNKNNLAATLRRSLAEELRVQLENVDATITKCMKASDNGGITSGIIISLTERFPIYDSNITHIGYLTKTELSSVVRCYSKLTLAVQTITTLGPVHGRANGMMYVNVGPDFVFFLKVSLENLRIALNDAVEKLDIRSAE